MSFLIRILSCNGYLWGQTLLGSLPVPINTENPMTAQSQDRKVSRSRQGPNESIDKLLPAAMWR